MADQLLGKAVDQMRLVLVRPGQAAAGSRLGGFEPGAVAGGLVDAKHPKRRNIALAAILLDLGLGQLGHRSSLPLTARQR